MLRKVILLVVLISAVTVFAAAAHASSQTFVGKIEEIAAKTQMTTVGANEKFLVIKLDSEPNTEFRITATDAARFHLTDSAQVPTVPRPGQVKGVGWKVRLTCNRIVTFGKEPYFQVTKLEKLD